MVALFELVGRALNNMDARAMTAAGVSLALLVFIAGAILFGADALGLDQARVQAVMAELADSPFAFLGLVLIYCALALTGFPQAILIAGTVAVFGVGRGMPFAWGATMASATLTYGVGRSFGAPFVRGLSAGRAATMMRVMQHRGGLASGIVRVVPSAPFVVVNAVCGAAHIPLWKYWLGTGIGIVPKIVFLSLFTGQAYALVGFFQDRDPARLWVIGLLVAGWLAFLVAVRALYMRLRRGSLAGLSD